MRRHSTLSRTDGLCLLRTLPIFY